MMIFACKVFDFFSGHLFCSVENIYHIDDYIGKKSQKIVLHGWKIALENRDNKYIIAILYKQSLILRVKMKLLG